MHQFMKLLDVGVLIDSGKLQIHGSVVSCTGTEDPGSVKWLFQVLRRKTVKLLCRKSSPVCAFPSDWVGSVPV